MHYWYRYHERAPRRLRQGLRFAVIFALSAPAEGVAERIARCTNAGGSIVRAGSLERKLTSRILSLVQTSSGRDNLTTYKLNYSGQGQVQTRHIPMEWILGILLSALAALAGTWLKGFLNPYIPSPARVRLFLKNIATPEPKPSGDRFHLVLCWLANDYSGHDTDTVERAFHAVPGVTLRRSSSIVKASGAADDWRPAMLKRARAVLHNWNADLAIVGLVKNPGEVLSLWFVPCEGEGTLDHGDARHYTLHEVSLGPDFHDDLLAQLRAMTLAAVAPLADNKARVELLEQGLQASANKIRALLKAQPSENPEVRAALQGALGTALGVLGERQSGTETLEKAANAYQAALEVQTRERAPLYWATHPEQSRRRPFDPRRARDRNGPPQAGRGGSSGGPRNLFSGPHAVATGHDPEQSRHRAFGTGRARGRDEAPQAGRGRSPCRN